MPTSLQKLNVPFTRPEKILFPGNGFTKGDLIQYYFSVSKWLLPHLRDRPVSLIRFPDGVGGESFYSKNAPDFTPDWVETTEVPRRRHDGTIRYILINNVETLAWCANLASIEIHPFLHRAEDLRSPTHVVFDLDPGEGEDLRTCAEVARLVKGITDKLGLELFPKVSGSKGLQLYLPLNTPISYAGSEAFARAIAQHLAEKHGDLVVSNMSKRLRKGRVLIDWSQNHPAKTTVSVYSVRGKREEPYVSMPVTWEELRRMKSPERLLFTPEQALGRLKEKGDLFGPLLKKKQHLPREFSDLRDDDLEAVSNGKPESISIHKSNTGGARLRRYTEKRDFTQTPEPGPRGRAKAKAKAKERGEKFVIQKHAATRLHFDLRLESEGTLKSWAVPKGLPMEPGVKRLAVEVEDHPLSYLDFEGVIPKGQYGGGTVMVWDIGTYELTKGSIRSGDVGFRLHGKKLDGEWHLFRIDGEGEKAQWLVVKADGKPLKLSKQQADRSAVSKRTMETIAKSGKQFKATE